MSSEFKFAMVELPNDITSKYISEIKEKADNIEDDIIQAMSSIINLDTSETDISDDIKEEDLFHLGEERLKIRKTAIKLLHSAIEEVLYPAMKSIYSSSGGLKRKDLVYIDIKGSTYVVTGSQKSYFSKSDSEAYQYLLALNISKILE